ncbi:zinc finger protein 479-like [Ischnura elegans]|uniref:zinc finger protein 479-like n=1 Tax=Ischnura elegans TaxID=197161 RepID=UPI001ED86E0A|nr:zinc finger protein 479-like [Ischnura elegans]
MDADARGAVLKDLDWKLIEAKKEPSAEESDAAKPTSTDNGEFIENWTIAHESTVEASGLAAPNRLHVKTPSASYLQGERDVKIDGSYDFLAHSTSGTLIGSESGASHAEEGRNVIEYDLQKCGTDKLTSCLFPDDGQYYTKYIKASTISGDGSRMSFVGGRGNRDAEDTVDTLCCVESREKIESGTEAFMREKEETSNCLVKNPGISCVANDSSYHCLNTIDGMGNESKFSKGLETHLGARNLDGDAESLNTSGPPTTSKTVKGLNMTRKCIRRKGKGPVEENSLGVGKGGNEERNRKFGTADSETCAQNLTSKSYSGVGINRDEARGSSMERVYSCCVCAETFTQIRTLGDHVLTHTGEKPYACSICSDRFSLSNSLSKHMRRHTGERPYSCNICGKSFTLGSNLDVHKRVHTREKPYSCDVCDKSFSTKNHLVIHCRTHSGERPYSCSICCRSFNQSSDLTKHKRSHTGEKPYSCIVCGKCFSLKSTLNRHKRTHRSGT